MTTARASASTRPHRTGVALIPGHQDSGDLAKAERTHMSLTTTQKLLGAATTVIGVAAFLAMPAAHADTSCTVPGAYLDLFQPDGQHKVSVQANGSNLGPGAVVSTFGVNPVYGKASGSIAGRTVDFIITWDDNKGTAVYRGTVGDDGVAHGTATGSVIPINLWNPGNWDSTGPLTCASTAPGPGTAKTATVTNDVDLYNKKNEPDGAGQVVGMLTAGTTVQLVGPCSPSSWCQVGGPNVPGGNGWVWGNLQL
jgi:hypothetical protein